MTTGLLFDQNILISVCGGLSLTILIVVELLMKNLSLACANELYRKSLALMEILSVFLTVFLFIFFLFTNRNFCGIINISSSKLDVILIGFLLTFSVLFFIISVNIYIENGKISAQDSETCGNATLPQTKGLAGFLMFICLVFLSILFYRIIKSIVNMFIK